MLVDGQNRIIIASSRCIRFGSKSTTRDIYREKLAKSHNSCVCTYRTCFLSFVGEERSAVVNVRK